MPDWEQVVDKRLGGMKLAPEERGEVVEEVAAHLEECYRELCDVGSPDPEGYTLAQVPDWKALGRRIQKSKEGPMNQIVRIFVCGMLTGIVASFLAAGVLVLVGRGDFLPTVAAAPRPSSFPGWSGSIPTNGFLHLAAGIWILWLYTAIRPSFGPGSKTAAVAGFAMWVIGALVTAIWSTGGLIPLNVFLVAAVVGLPAWVLGAVAGAWSFEATERRPSRLTETPPTQTASA
ncbi:MAG: hypothetical protein ACRD35_02335 [Candidatus Acidiferrales bacterium]